MRTARLLGILPGMQSTDLDEAISRLCKQFTWTMPVEILIVGGAAGMLTGTFAPDRVTGDVDVMIYCPNSAMVELECLASRLGQELGLPNHWSNSKVQIRTDTLPDDWKDRRQLVDRGAFLSVYAASRKDLMAMKFLAHRPQDLEDIDKPRFRWTIFSS